MAAHMTATDDTAQPDGASSQKRPLVSVDKVSRTRKAAKLKDKVARSGLVYMSRVPPHLKPLKLRQMLERYGELGRIYMAPKDRRGSGVPTGVASNKMRGREYSEAWIEFADKKLAKAVCEMINGQPMGGKRRSRYHEDLWTLRYLPKFKWEHLTEEIDVRTVHNLSMGRHLSNAVDAKLASIAYQKAVQEKRLAQELAHAKQERDFYLGKVAQSKKNSAILDRKRKKGVQVEDVRERTRASYTQQEPLASSDGGGRMSKSVLALIGGGRT